MEPLTNAERETHFNQSADNRDEWDGYSDDPVNIRWIDRIATAYKVNYPGQQQESKFYKLTKSQLRLFLASKPMSDEQRRAAGERLNAALAQKQNNAEQDAEQDTEQDAE